MSQHSSWVRFTDDREFRSASLVQALHSSSCVKPDVRRKPSQLPHRIEEAMLEVLTRPITTISEREDAMRRELELRALFVALAPDAAHNLVRRFDGGNDPLAQALRRFIRSR
jgi:hypothetical protein